MGEAGWLEGTWVDDQGVRRINRRESASDGWGEVYDMLHQLPEERRGAPVSGPLEEFELDGFTVDVERHIWWLWGAVATLAVVLTAVVILK